MTSETSLARNTLYSAATSASNVLLIVLVIVAARVLGDRSFGQFSLALALTLIFETVIDLGLNTLTARDVPRDRALARLYLPNILGWKLILSAVAAGLLVLSVNLLNQPTDARTATYILGGASILRSHKATSHAFFQAYERFDLILVTTYVERAALLVFGIGALLLTPSLIALAVVFVLVRIPDLLFAYWLLHREITPVRVELNPKVVKNLQAPAMPFGLYAVVLVVYCYAGTVVLAALRPAHEVGWYNASYKVYEGLTMFPSILGAVLLPRLSRLFVIDGDRHTALSLGVLRYLVLGSLPLAISVGMLAPRVVILLYGEAYLPAVPVLRILLGAAALMFVNWTLNTVLISADREKSVLRIAATGLVVMVAANLILVGQLGMKGAAYSVLVSETCVFALLLGIVRRVLFGIPVRALAWRPTVACISALGVLYMSHLGMTLASTLLFAAAYTAMLLMLRTFHAHEWLLVKSVLSRIALRQ